VFVDDEDEFDEHRIAFGYPPEVVELARRSCDEVLSAVTSRVPPYDGPTAQRWLDVLRGVER
jgi:protein associated with RNAse G/E